MKHRSGNDIRREFIEFFQERGHTFVPSASLLPADDPTLLFTNAGMNQFKAIFLGTEMRDYTRAANSQKCIRAGGKHNDLEDVGHDTYHHTFFEMLGNWSFGDYFKTEAIDWAWELLTEVWGLDPERLHATYFQGDAADGLDPDEEARELWSKYLPAERIHPGNKKDNFWEMGDTGPCGPCSELHIDLTPDKSGGELVNADSPRVIEIWNLVFIQFNRDAEGQLSPLPAQHVDTGMGFERIAMVLQEKTSNYATDVFRPIIEQIETLTEHKYGKGVVKKVGQDRFNVPSGGDLRDVACRVLADHARTLTFAIADGILPSNDGRGYVIRRILRRAARYGRQYLDIDGPFLGQLVPTIVEHFGEAFPEIRQRRDAVLQILREEEESFGRTLDRGIDLFEKQVDNIRSKGGKEIPGQTAFELYATYGFPVDLTALMARERGMEVDMEGFEQAMAEHAEISRAGGDTFKVDAIVGLPATDDSAKYSNEPIDATVVGWVVDGAFVSEGELADGDEAAIVLDRTNFYGEQGGQVGDVGALQKDGAAVFDVSDTKVAGQSVLHVGSVIHGPIRAGDAVRCVVCPSRMDTMRNHSATHLLNWGLRQVLDEEVDQAGSVVSADRLRFDFTHSRAVTPDELRQVEYLVNQFILDDAPIGVNHLPLDEAKKLPGVRAVFGEKYPDPVRVVSMGVEDPRSDARPSRVSVEFCGGTHLKRTGQVGLFKIVSEESVAKGVRRITALTGREAVGHVQMLDEVTREAASTLKTTPEEIPARIVAMQKEIKTLRKKPAAGGGGAVRVTGEVASSQGPVLIARADHADPAVMRAECDKHRQKGAAAMIVGGTDGEKVVLVAMVAQQAVDELGIKAGDWVKTAATVAGGGGGGKPTMAQAGGKDPAKLDDALQAAATWAADKVG
ncbi:MAG: alanine--tRNA ligase [Phycisphaerae bacterium]